MIVMGLDPGIARCGYGIIDTAKPKLFVRCGCVTTSPASDTSERLLQIGKDLRKIIQEERVDKAVVEEVFFGTNTTTALLTAQARGVLLYELRLNKVAIITLTPLQIKSRLTGFGRADKKQVQALVQARLKLSSTPKPDDAADALAAALCVVDNNSIVSTISA